MPKDTLRQAPVLLHRDFIPHEDLRNAWSPAKVLHYATELAGIAKVGPAPPYLSPLSAEQMDTLALVERNVAALTR